MNTLQTLVDVIAQATHREPGMIDIDAPLSPAHERALTHGAGRRRLAREVGICLREDELRLTGTLSNLAAYIDLVHAAREFLGLRATDVHAAEAARPARPARKERDRVPAR